MRHGKRGTSIPHSGGDATGSGADALVMSAATVAFGEPPIASPELALVDSALAAELRRTLPDPAARQAPPTRQESAVTESRTLSLVVVPEPAPEIVEPDTTPDAHEDPVVVVEAVAVTAPEAEDLSEERLAEQVVGLLDRVEEQLSTDAAVETVALDVGSIEFADVPADDCTDLIVGHVDEVPVAADEVPETTPEAFTEESDHTLEPVIAEVAADDLVIAHDVEVPVAVAEVPEPAPAVLEARVVEPFDHVAVEDDVVAGTDDLIVGYAETAAAIYEAPEPAAAVLEAQVVDAVDPVDAEDDAVHGSCDDLIVGFGAETSQADERTSAYPMLPVPAEGFDTTAETDEALRSIQNRLTGKQTTTAPKRRFRRRFTLMSGVVGVASVAVLAAQQYGGILP